MQEPHWVCATNLLGPSVFSLGATGFIQQAGSVVNDYNGDGRSDLALFDNNTPSTGSGQAGAWYIQTLSGTQVLWAASWGWPGAQPVPGDYDGDGVSDIAVFDQNTGAWSIRTLGGSVEAWGVSWGWSGAEPVSGDYDGDGLDDLAVFDSNTGYWYIRTVSGTILVWALPWGWPGAVPVGE
ncbi:MAG: VCBS repeat-containing protein [Lentisphaerae bacterium]|nr:VCBS repeat-containing protein [Lentisphaerota bacterium]